MSSQRPPPCKLGDPLKKYLQMNHHILCVDDEKTIGELLVVVFRHYTNCKIAYVMSAKEAFEYLENNQVDLVITNIYMPGMDGLEMAKIIINNYPTKVIIMTGSSSSGVRECVLRMGVKAYIRKPCDPDELLEIANKVLTKNLTYIGEFGGKR